MFDTKRIGMDFSRAANNYATHAELQLRIGKALIHEVAPALSPGALLLDIGAGSGEVSALWPTRVIALDLAFGMCERAQEKNLHAVNADACKLPFAADAVDAVASNLMVQWLPAPHVFFAEAHRVLKKNGVLAVTSFAEGTLYELRQAFEAAGEPDRMSEFAPSEELAAVAKQSGFEIVISRSETYAESYSHVMGLWRFLRAIGASNKRTTRPRGLMTPRTLSRIESYYPRSDAGIQASWVVHTVIAKKI